MTIKRFLAALAAAALLIPFALQAQTESEIAAARAELAADRQKVVAANLTMTEAEAEAFWPIYREYRNDMEKTGDKTLILLKEYASAYMDDSMTDEQGEKIVRDYLKVRTEQLKIKENYVPKFNKVLMGKKLMRYYQIEQKLDILVQAGLASEIPLAETGK